MTRTKKRPPKTQRPGEPARQRRQEDQIEDLLILRPSRLPTSNPRYVDHAPTTTSIVDVAGLRVNVLEWRTVFRRANRAGLGDEVRVNEWTPLPAADLWKGPLHHQLTHALRLMLVSSVHSSNGHGYDHPDMRRLRGSFIPAQLLIGTGLSQSEAVEIIKRLRKLDLLRCIRVDGKDVWFVHAVFRGVGPQLEKYSRADLVDEWVLPEDLFSSQNGGGDPMREQKKSPPANQPVADKRQRQLNLALDVLRRHASAEHVASNGEKTPAGYIQMQPDGGVFALLRREIGGDELRDRSVDRRFYDLTQIGIVESRPMGPKPRLVRIKADAVEVTSQDMVRLRQIEGERRGQQPSARKQPPPVRTEPQPMAPRIGVEELEALAKKLDAFAERVQQLEAEGQDKDERIQQLEAQLAQASTVPSDLQERLSKYLEA